MFCRKCGAQLKDGVKFCNKCGASLTAGAKPAMQPAAATAPRAMNPGGSTVPAYTPPKTDLFVEPVALTTTPTCTETCCSHKKVPAVTHCASCDQPICEECADEYILSDESLEFSDQPICFNCAKKVYEEEIEQHKSNLMEVYLQFGITLLGMIVGAFLFGADTGIGGVLFGFLIGGCLGSFLITVVRELIKLLLGIVSVAVSGGGSGIGIIFKSLFTIAVTIVKSIWITFSKLVRYTIYFTKTMHYKKQAEEGLRAMTGYYEYTLVRAENQGTDLSTLMSNGMLTNNSFAQSVLSVGEEQAHQNIEQSRLSFQEFGKLVHNFEASKAS